MAGTGLTRFFLAKYSAENGVVTYSDGGEFFDAISFQETPAEGDDAKLYVNNNTKETSGGRMTSAELVIGTDHLSLEASALILGITLAAKTFDGETFQSLEFGNNVNPPALGFGAIQTGQLNDVAIYKPVVYTKVKFKIPSGSYTTQGESVEWQTPELNATAYTDDTVAEVLKSETLTETLDKAVMFIKGYLNMLPAQG
jgi:hypothetical protein